MSLSEVWEENAVFASVAARKVRPRVVDVPLSNWDAFEALRAREDGDEEIPF